MHQCREHRAASLQHQTGAGALLSTGQMAPRDCMPAAQLPAQDMKLWACQGPCATGQGARHLHPCRLVYGRAGAAVAPGAHMHQAMASAASWKAMTKASPSVVTS